MSATSPISYSSLQTQWNEVHGFAWYHRVCEAVGCPEGRHCKLQASRIPAGFEEAKAPDIASCAARPNMGKHCRKLERTKAKTAGHPDVNYISALLFHFHRTA